MNTNEREKAQEKYVEARVLQGKTQEQAKAFAGYSVGTSPANIEKNPRVRSLMDDALERKGITEDYIAEQYKNGLEASLRDGAKEKDLNATAQLLRGLTFLKGYGKKEVPSVAVQINNGTMGGVNDSSPTAEQLDEVKAAIELLAAAVGHDQSRGFLKGDIGIGDSPACPGVDSPSTSEAEDGGGGQP